MTTENYLQIIITTQLIIMIIEVIRLFLSLKSKFKRERK